MGRIGQRKETSKGGISDKILIQQGNDAGLILSQSHTPTHSKGAGLTTSHQLRASRGLYLSSTWQVSEEHRCRRLAAKAYQSEEGVGK